MESKKAKTPKLNAATRLLSFDLETNGLHGQAFAVGAIILDAKGKIYDQFVARCPLEGDIDKWVKLNVLPAVKDLAQTHETYKDMREAFWNWYIKAEPNSDYVLVNNGYPVEYKFLLDCQLADLEKRYWEHPFPILDLASLLIQVGLVPATSRSLVSQNYQKLRSHNPLDDAKLAILTAFEAFKLSGQIK